MLVRDRLGELFGNEQCADWYPVSGCPSLPTSQLVLVSVLQSRRDFTNRQAADAVRSRNGGCGHHGLSVDGPQSVERP